LIIEIKYTISRYRSLQFNLAIEDGNEPKGCLFLKEESTKLRKRFFDRQGRKWETVILDVLEDYLVDKHEKWGVLHRVYVVPDKFLQLLRMIFDLAPSGVWRRVPWDIGKELN